MNLERLQAVSYTHLDVYKRQQKDLSLLNNYLFDIDEVYEYLNTTIVNFKEKNILKSTFIIINSLIKNNMMCDNDSEKFTIDIDNEEEDEDEFDKVFTSVKTNENDKNNLRFEQTVMFQTGGTRKTLTTPGEKGGYLIKIEIIDTKNLVNVAKNDRWTKAAYRAAFLVDSSKDLKYVQLYKMCIRDRVTRIT